MKIQSKTKELIVSFSDEMYLIKQVKDTNIRESTGFAFQQDLYLWPEEAWYLVNRQLAEGLEVDCRLDIAGFYSHMRRDGLFLTRFSNFHHLKEHLLTQNKPPEDLQTIKRVKQCDQEESKQAEERIQ